MLRTRMTIAGMAVLLMTTPVQGLYASGLPLAAMAAITGEIVVNTLILNGDANPNLIQIQYNAGLSRYQIATSPADTITLSDPGGQATAIAGNGTNNVLLQIADANLVGIEVYGGDGADTIQMVSVNDTMYVGGGAQDDTISIGSNMTGNLQGGGGADHFSLLNGVVLTGSIEGEGGLDTLTRVGNNVTVELGNSVANGYSGTATGLTGGFSTIDTIVASGTTTVLRSKPDFLTFTWDIDSTPTHFNGTHTLSFSGFDTLEGSALGDDNFEVSVSSSFDIIVNGGNNSLQIVGGANYTGTYTGGFGTDSLTTDAVQTVQLTNETESGWDGTATSPASFTGVDILNSTAPNSQLEMGFQPVATPVTWTFDGTPALIYQFLSGLQFSGFTGVACNTLQNTFNVSANTTVDIVGNTGNDTLNITNGATLTGSFTAGTGFNTLTTSASGIDILLSSFANGGYNGTATNLSGGFEGIRRVETSGSNGSVTGMDILSDWALSTGKTAEYDSGDTNNLEIQGFDQLIGNASADTFVVTGSSTMSADGGGGNDLFQMETTSSTTGGFNGGEGGDELQLNLANIDLELVSSTDQGFSGNASNITMGFSGISILTSNQANNRLMGSLSATFDPVTWVLDGTPTFDDNAHVLEFSGFSTLQSGLELNDYIVSANTTVNIVGSGAEDTLSLQNDAILTGSFDGAGSPSAIDSITSTADNFNVVITDSGALGFDGTATGISNGFMQVDKITGSGANSSLTGDNSQSWWDFASPNRYYANLSGPPDTVTPDLEFSGFESVTGGNQQDTFVLVNNRTVDISGGGGDDHLQLNENRTLTGFFDGGFGVDSIQFNSSGESVALTASNSFGMDGTASHITGGWTNVLTLEATGGLSSLAGYETPSCFWTLDDTPQFQSTQNLAFSGFEILNGCVGVNTVTVDAPIAAGVGSSLTFNGSSFDDLVDFNLSNADLDIPVTFDGGMQSTASGDRITISGVVPDTVEYQFGAAGGLDINGKILMTDNSIITFSDLETVPQPPFSTTNVIADFQPFDTDLVLQDGAPGYWEFLLDGVTYLSTNRTISSLTVRPPEALGGSRFTINTLNFNAGLSVVDTADTTDVLLAGPVTIDSDFNLEARADTVEVSGTVQTQGSGTLTLRSNGNLSLSSGSAAVISQNAKITLGADADKNDTGEFLTWGGSQVNSGEGDLFISAVDMAFGGTITGGLVDLTVSRPGSHAGFRLGGEGLGLVAGDSAPGAEPPAISSVLIDLSTADLGMITASDRLRIGNNLHGYMFIEDTLDFGGNVTDLSLLINWEGNLYGNVTPEAEVNVNNLTTEGTLNYFSGRGIFDIQANWFANSNTAVYIIAGGTTPGIGSGNHSQVNVLGTVNLEGSPVLDFRLSSFTPSPGDQFVVVNNDGVDPIVGTFAGLPEGAMLSWGDYDFRISYLGIDESTGNDVVITAVVTDPENIFTDGFEDPPVTP